MLFIEKKNRFDSATTTKQLPAPPPLANAFRAGSCLGSCAGKTLAVQMKRFTHFSVFQTPVQVFLWNAFRVFGAPGPITLLYQALWPSYPNPVQARWIFVRFFGLVPTLSLTYQSPSEFYVIVL